MAKANNILLTLIHFTVTNTIFIISILHTTLYLSSNSSSTYHQQKPIISSTSPSLTFSSSSTVIPNQPKPNIIHLNLISTLSLSNSGHTKTHSTSSSSHQHTLINIPPYPLNQGHRRNPTNKPQGSSPSLLYKQIQRAHI